ncbi:nucleoside permease [Aeromonas bivalvium]|uniref:nucleoside permease n=1 Tax=Aeromonas bivalvium TaxID=440079 RepID=UPI0038D0551C
MDTKRLMMPRLSVMMFLQFFIWGAWYTSIAVYMSQAGMGSLTHWPYTVNPIAAIVAPFFLGLVADRFFATQKVLALLHMLGGVILCLTPATADNHVLFVLMLLAYNLCYMPTLGLSNAIAFKHIDDQEKQFPMIRVFGTIGWIIAGLFISFMAGKLLGIEGVVEKTPVPLYVAGAASILLGLYCLTLPATLPNRSQKPLTFSEISGLSALKELASPAFMVFLAASFLICIPLAAYYNFTQLFLSQANIENIAGIQTLGQASEIIFMLLMPLFFKRFGVKTMLLVGMLAWVARYVLFAYSATDSVVWMIMLGIALHGICYDFFFVTGQIYVDKRANDRIRSQAQGLMVLVTYGIGMFIGALIAGEVYNQFLDGAEALTPENWAHFWWLPALFALGVALLFMLFFKEKTSEIPSQTATARQH